MTRSTRSEMMRQRWKDPEWRARVTAKMRANWDDPEWSARVRAAIGEGRASAWRDKGGPRSLICKGKRMGNQVTVSVLMPNEMFLAVRGQAVKRSKTFAETVRTYLQWGLENDGVET